ncbi:MAG: hypothetical protein D3906_09730 [Candidatus Electrothrix sp. AUS1_2]|nr:hypothetical protein [Candidatus Electrothrix sp. AUS1_2]
MKICKYILETLNMQYNIFRMRKNILRFLFFRRAFDRRRPDGRAKIIPLFEVSTVDSRKEESYFILPEKNFCFVAVSYKKLLI